jgi:hypothetical protein
MTQFQNTLVIGGGFWGEKYIKELGRNCVAVVDKNQDRLKYLENTYGVLGFIGVEEFLKYAFNRIFYNHVIIATPPENHIPYAHYFCVEGKYVLIEKPLCEKEEHGHCLYKFPEQVMVGHIYTYNPGIIALKEKLKTFAAHHIYCRRTNNGPVRIWQNALWDLAPHDISICNFLLDQTPLNYDIIDKYDYGIIELEYIACSALIYVSWLGGPKVRQVELVPASNGERIIFDDLKQVTEVSPLHLMLNDFYGHNWNKWCSLQAGLDIVKILENARSHEILSEHNMEFIN